MKHGAGISISLLTIWLALLAPVRAETIVLAVPGPGNLAFLPVYLAKAIGADTDEGLELKLRHFNSGPLAIRDLMTRNSDFVVIGLPAIATARADGIPVYAIGQLSQSAMFVFMLRADLKHKVRTLAQLSHRRIGTPTGNDKQRAMGTMVAEHLFRKAGLTPNDVQFIPTGLNRQSQRAALSTHLVDALLGDEPFASEMVAEGLAVVLADMYPPRHSNALLGGNLVRAALATRENVYAKHPQTVKKVLRMLNRSLQWIAQHTPTECAEILAGQPGFNLEQRQALIAILQRGLGMFPDQVGWDQHALDATEKFFHNNANNPAEAKLSFADFIRHSPANE